MTTSSGRDKLTFIENLLRTRYAPLVQSSLQPYETNVFTLFCIRPLWLRETKGTAQGHKASKSWSRNKAGALPGLLLGAGNQRLVMTETHWADTAPRGNVSGTGLPRPSALVALWICAPLWHCGFSWHSLSTKAVQSLCLHTVINCNPRSSFLCPSRVHWG